MKEGMIMSRTLSRLLTLTTVIILSATHPGILSAQTSGIGKDGFTRILWRGTDGRIALWKLDANLVKVAEQQYGPYPGFEPIALTIVPVSTGIGIEEDITYVLWTNTDGSISLWKVDSNLNWVTSKVSGPFAGWTAQGLSSGNGELRMIWRHTTGAVSVWIVDPNTLAAFAREHGPFFGFDPGAR